VWGVILRILLNIKIWFVNGKPAGVGVTVELPTFYNKEKPVPDDSKVDWAKLVRLGKQLVGKPYRFGEEVSLKETDPSKISAIDCSELVEWLFAQVGIVVPDGSYNQFKVSNPVAGDLRTGDLGFKWIPETHAVHHVGVWIGDTVLEAKGKAWGVVLTPRKDFEASPHFAMWRRLSNIKDA
jgi:cell wall-associated NlpC family hydrolase